MNNIKERMGKVLRCNLSDADCDYIKAYYQLFYAEPEEFEDDFLLDYILDDLGKTMGKCDVVDTTLSSVVSTSDESQKEPTCIEEDYNETGSNNIETQLPKVDSLYSAVKITDGGV